MLLDELPTAFLDDVIAEAAAVAKSAEASFGDMDAFGRHLREMGEQRNDLAGQLMIVDALICAYMMAAPEQAVATGFLAPSIEWTNGGVFPPPPGRFPDSVRTYLEKRANETTIAQLSARYYEFVWLRWNDHRSGRAARAAYVMAAGEADLTEASSAIPSMQHLARAAELAMILSDEREATREVIFEEVRRGLAADSLGHACALAERSARLIASDHAKAIRLANEFGDAAEAARGAGEHHRARSYLEAAEALAKAVGDEALAASSRERIASSFESEAQSATSGLIAHHWYDEAVKAHRNLGHSADVDRLKRLMREASERMLTELKPIGATASIPHEAIEEAATATSVGSVGSPAGMLALPEELGLWPDWELVADETERSVSAHPLTNLMPTLSVEWDARAQPEPDDEAERAIAQQVRNYNQQNAILLGVAGMVVDDLRTRGAWSEEAVLAGLALAGEDISISASAGIRLYEEGDYWSAVHVLVPQIERSVRLLGRLTAGEIERLSSGGGFRWAALNGLLTDERIRAALGDSFATELEALLVSPYGRNLRNNVAHGALDPNRDHQDNGLLATFILLSVANRIVRTTNGPASDAREGSAGG